MTGVAHTTLTLNANGSFTYVPTAGYVGVDSFVCKATNGTSSWMKKPMYFDTLWREFRVLDLMHHWQLPTSLNQ